MNVVPCSPQINLASLIRTRCLHVLRRRKGAMKRVGVKYISFRKNHRKSAGCESELDERWDDRKEEDTGPKETLNCQSSVMTLGRCRSCTAL